MLESRTPPPREERLPDCSLAMDTEACEEAVEAVSTAEEGYVVPAATPATPKRGRLIVNLISNVAIFGFNVLIGIWYTPYLIRHLGASSYGIIPLVSQITSYMIVITATLKFGDGPLRHACLGAERRRGGQSIFQHFVVRQHFARVAAGSSSGLGRRGPRQHRQYADRPGNANPLVVSLHRGGVLPWHVTVAVSSFLFLPQPLRSAKHDRADAASGAVGVGRAVFQPADAADLASRLGGAVWPCSSAGAGRSDCGAG